MITDLKKGPEDLTVEEKLKTLYELQSVLSEIDKIKTLRGELPLEVKDLEDEVVRLNTRIENIKTDMAELKKDITKKKGEISEAKLSIDK